MFRGYIVVGPERSGTRMLTKAIISTGVFGDSTHDQRLDSLDFKEVTGDIVIRRSIPHRGKTPDIVKLVDQIRLSKRQVYGLIIIRSWKGITGSRLMGAWSHPSIPEAVVHAYRSFACLDFEIEPILVDYELFVTFPEVRKNLFKRIGLKEPKMKFFNADDKYKEK